MGFGIFPLSDEIKKKITGVTYPLGGCKELSYEDLAYVQILHYGFAGEILEGELIVNKRIAEDILEIFKELFELKYQVEKVRLIDEYGAQDEDSMADNNSSAFNYRVIYGTNTLSNHALGYAIDINPLYNPYISIHGGKEVIQPANSTPYVDREKEFLHKIDHEDACYKAFARRGFTWGGDWKHSKDYQHFEKVLKNE